MATFHHRPIYTPRFRADDSRARERNRRLYLTIGTSGLSKTIVAIAPLVTTPLTLHYLGTERYGLWMTVTSIVSMFAFADLGLGNGLLTKLGDAFGKDDDEKAQKYISSAYFIVAFVALFFFCLSFIGGFFIPWEKVLNASSPTIQKEAHWVAVVCFAFFLIHLPFGLIQRVQLGVQQGFQTNLWQCVASLLSMGLIIIAVLYKAGIVVLVACAVGVAPIVSAINGEFFFRYQGPQFRPRWSLFEWHAAKDLLRLGLLFFILSILTLGTAYADNLIVAQVLGLGAVAYYAIPAKIAALLAAVINMLCLPLWPANGEAMARGDLGWVRRSTRKMFFLSISLVGLAVVALVAVGPSFMRLWIGGEFIVGRFLLVSMGIWVILLSGTGPFFMVLNGAGKVRFQVYVWLIFLPASIVLKFFLANKLGFAGVPLASAIAYALIVIPSMIVAYRRLMNC